MMTAMPRMNALFLNVTLTRMIRFENWNKMRTMLFVMQQERYFWEIGMKQE